MNKLVIYNHGKDSIPWGEKPLALADVAKRHGYHFKSLDYRPNNDPDQRVAQLLAFDVSAYQHIVLAGSSMGAYVATVAAETIKVQGLFLIAPAFYLPGYQHTQFKPSTNNIEVFHGWQDDVVPAENAWRFSRIHHARLHMLDADHRLLAVLPEMVIAFDSFLEQLTAIL
jgi:pimeloyl-ACP methyl ester carboxylesterase